MRTFPGGCQAWCILFPLQKPRYYNLDLIQLDDHVAATETEMIFQSEESFGTQYSPHTVSLTVEIIQHGSSYEEC